MITNIFINTLLLSFSGSVIALILFAVRPFIKLKLSKTWQYYIWLAVILRLLIPYKPEISLMSGLYKVMENNNWIMNASMTGTVGIILKYIGIAWLSIAVILLLKKIISYQIYVCFIKANRKLVTDVNITGIYSEVCNEIGIKRKIGLYSYKMINSPMLIGFFKPYIVLPEAMLQKPEGLKYVLLHELTHHKRKDFLYKWLIQITLCIHFFNPIIFLIRDTVNKICEFSCDETVIKKLDNRSKKAYGSALISSLEINGEYRQHTTISLMLCEDVKLIKDRLDAIIQYKRSSKIIITATYILTAMICLSSIYIGVFKNIYANCSCHCLKPLIIISFY